MATFEESIQNYDPTVRRVLAGLFTGFVDDANFGGFWREIYEEFCNSGWGYFVKSEMDYALLRSLYDETQYEDTVILDLLKKFPDLSYKEAVCILNLDAILASLSG